VEFLLRSWADRAGDDTMAAQRSRPRASTPFAWSASFDQVMAEAKNTGRKVILEFWTSWCGPCKTMDEWIWPDAEAAAVLNAGYVGVKLDGGLEKALVVRLGVRGYPTVVLLDAGGTELTRFEGYLSSNEVLNVLGPKR
jgi:thiol-disulfide isomerase/thioredoxin